MKRTRTFFLLSVLTGCAGLIGVPDLTFDESPDGGRDGATETGVLTDGTSPVDANRPDAPIGDARPDGPLVDSATCDLGKIATDKNNCGACGHVCLGSSGCANGVCEATQLGNVPTASWRTLIEHGDWLYAGVESGSTEEGIWRISKTLGNPTRIIPLEGAHFPIVVGDRLYFIINDYAYDDAGYNGGIWYCDLAEAETAATCTPKLAEAVERPYMFAAGGRGMYYGFSVNFDDAIRRFVPDGGDDAGGAPIPLNTQGGPELMYVDSKDIFYSSVALVRAYLHRINAFGTQGETIQQYSTVARTGGAGNIRSTDSSVIVAFFDDGVNNERGGKLLRLSRTGALECSYATGTDGGVFRPEGVFVDGPQLYWTNRGFAYSPFFGGSIATCPVDGCCTEPKILWSGTGSPSAIVGDDTYLYWLNVNNGDIWRVQKP